MQELRRVKRTQLIKSGRVVTADSVATIDCLVLDLTNCGAGLQISARDLVPDCFDLIFDSRLFSRSCRVRWRNAQRLGVEFFRTR
jgi:hypothetical protein